MSSDSKDPNSNIRPTMTALELFVRFGEVGFVIAIPLAILMFAGAKLDQQFETSPLFIFIALGLSLITTSWGIYTFIKNISK